MGKCKILIILTISIIFLAGCSNSTIEQENTAESQPSGNKVAEVTATVTPASTSTQMQEDDVLQWLKNPAAVDSFAFGQIEKVLCRIVITASQQVRLISNPNWIRWPKNKSHCSASRPTLKQ